MSILDSNDSLSITNITLKEPGITPLLDPQVSLIILYVVGIALIILTGVLGIFTNMVNICVYLKMGIKETINMKVFALSVSDLLVCMATVVATFSYYQKISNTGMPSEIMWIEISIVAIWVSYPSQACSAWVTAVLSVERYLCIATPLKVKDILTTRKTRALILTMAAYQFVFWVLLLVVPGPPYYKPDARRALYLNFSFSAPTFICFFIVSLSTVLLIIRLRRNLEWRSESTAQSSKRLGNAKEKRATRSVLAVCTLFIACFSPTIGVFLVSALYRKFNQPDPYLGSLFMAVYSFSNLFQVFCASVNICVYYSMSTKYREVFNSLFCRHINQNH